MASDMTPPPAGYARGQPAELGYWGDQRGCYWERGRRFCKHYCYWEVDGRRYCNERERVAYPQGDPWFVPYPPEPPIYLRPPSGRP
jgi:hypothetical protein